MYDIWEWSLTRKVRQSAGGVVVAEGRRYRVSRVVVIKNE